MEFVCFGEIMGRLNPEGYERIVQAHRLEISYGGGEANVAVSLANFGKKAVFITKVPENNLADSAIQSLKAHNVDVSRVIRGGDRMGLYFMERGASQRENKILYDRKYSAISMASKEDFDWKKIFAETEWFHFTGITPALSDSCAEICLEACRTAKELGVTISCDLSYRKSLWDGKKANQVMSTLMPYVNVLIADEEDCAKVFNIGREEGNSENGTSEHPEIAKILSDRFSIPTVAVTVRKNVSADSNDWSAVLFNHGEYYRSKEYRIHIVDYLGTEDSFCGGLIYALSEGQENQFAVDFAVAASTLKQTICNDFNEVTVSEVKGLMNGTGTGRVQR